MRYGAGREVRALAGCERGESEVTVDGEESSAGTTQVARNYSSYSRELLRYL